MDEYGGPNTYGTCHLHTPPLLVSPLATPAPKLGREHRGVSGSL